MDLHSRVFDVLRESIVCLGIAALLPMLVFYATTLFIKPLPQPQEHMIPNFQQKMQQLENEEEKKSLYTQQMQMRNVYLKKIEEHSLAFFLFSLFVGLCALILGAFMPSIGIGSGFVLGGILSVVQGYYFYWFYLTDTLRFVSLLVAMALLFAAGHIKITKKRAPQL